ncbi:MAG: DUF3015 domain-containing protein [Gammaproteobacteria bacterium]|nr:DUF3015 domain-containing protein [Gammaproteobacteria bacterium]
MKQHFKTILFAGLVSGLSACTAITDVTSSVSSTLDAVTPDITLNNFIDKRFEAIRKDAASGGGENIDALAELMGKRDSAKFAAFMQQNYDQLFSNVSRSSELIARIEQYNEPGKG